MDSDSTGAGEIRVTFGLRLGGKWVKLQYKITGHRIALPLQKLQISAEYKRK